MKRKQGRIIMGTAISAAAIAVMIDHTRQRLPEGKNQVAAQAAVIIIDEGEELPAATTGCEESAPKGRRQAPCSL